MAPQSIEIISPSFKGSLVGNPCTTWEFGLIQSVFGKSYKPKKPGIAPCSLMYSSANLSNCKVVTPGFTSLANMPKVRETTKALSRINSISSFVFTLIILKKYGQRYLKLNGILFYVS